MPRRLFYCDSCETKFKKKSDLKNYGGTLLCNSCAYSLRQLSDITFDVQNVESTETFNENQEENSNTAILDMEVDIESAPENSEENGANFDLQSSKESILKKDELVLEPEPTKIKLNFKRFSKSTKWQAQFFFFITK